MRWVKFFSIAALVVLVAFAGGCSLTGSKDNSATPPVNPQPTKEEVQVTLYFGDDQAMYLKPEKRTVEKGGKPMAELLVQELIKGPQTKGLHKTVPEEAKLISLEVVDGVAFINFSREMQTKHWGGSAGETMTVQSIVHTLTQLPEIEKVQFLIEGKKEEAIWGHGDTSQPVSPVKDIIAK